MALELLPKGPKRRTTLELPAVTPITPVTPVIDTHVSVLPDQPPAGEAQQPDNCKPGELPENTKRYLEHTENLLRLARR